MHKAAFERELAEDFVRPVLYAINHKSGRQGDLNLMRGV